MEETIQEKLKMPIIEFNDIENLKSKKDNYFYKLLLKNESEDIILNNYGTNKVIINYNLYIRTCLFMIMIILFYITIDAPYLYDYYKNREEIHNALIRGKNYFEKCIHGIFPKSIKISNLKNPDISVVILVYKGVVRSIQNQNYNNFEIILVNDFSTDNVLKIIMEMQKEDPRITLINNNENRGTLYSRCIGVLSIKGKYVFL